MSAVRITEDQLNAIMERRLRDYLARDIHDLDFIGAGYIPYAVRARRYLELYAEANRGTTGAATAPPKLTLVPA